MSLADLSSSLSAAAQLAREAGAAAMRHYGAARAQFKGDGGPVTVADRASNAVIVAGLAHAFPADMVLSEESLDSADRLDASRIWIVDPLDGTREFLAGNGEFSVMIGLAQRGRAVLGVIYQPAQDLLFAGAVGLGAVVERAGLQRPLHLPLWTEATPRLLGSRSHAEPLVEKVRAALGLECVVPCGSVGVKCARIAQGEADLYVHPASVGEWDTCAPEALLRAAGGSVTDCLGGMLSYNKPVPRQPRGILAAAPGLLPRVLPVVGRAFMERVPGAGSLA